jgi:hypothetical protein
LHKTAGQGNTNPKICINSEWRHHDVIGNQSVYTKRTSAQSIFSRVRLHVSTRG